MKIKIIHELWIKNIYYDIYKDKGKCNVPMTPHVRLLVGWFVGWCGPFELIKSFMVARYLKLRSPHQNTTSNESNISRRRFKGRA